MSLINENNTKKVFLRLSCYDTNGVTSRYGIFSEKKNDEYPPHNTGIGNMLFQIASGLSYALKNNATLHVPGLNSYLKLMKLNKEDTIFRNINTELIDGYDEKKLVGCGGRGKHKRFNIHNIPFYDNINLSDYFENFDNFHEYKKLIIDYFKPTEKDVEYLIHKYPIIKNDNLASIHIRRGKDYEKIYNSNDLTYIDNCTFKLLDHMIINKNITNYFVLTNDKKHCNKILDNNPKYKNINFYYSNEIDFFDCWILSLIKNNINSFSTLSWWGAYLNQHKDKYVIYRKNTLRKVLKTPGWKCI
tara:strand:+ start:14 stop:919 length:906 start_codon:yes stop_codon:yes gene_type:complete